MTRLSTTEVRDKLSDTINRVAYGGERILLERRGKDVAAFISIDDLNLFLRLLGEYEDRLDVDAADASLAESDERIPYEKVRRELGLTE